MAFEESFRGGVHVALGYARDGGATVFATAGRGGGPRLRSFDVATGTPRLDQMVFEGDFRGGLALSAGDWTGDGVADAMTGAGTGGGPRVTVIDGRTGAVVEDFFAVGQNGRKGINPVAMVGPDGYMRLAAVASDPEPWVRVMGTRADDGKVVEVDALGPFTDLGEEPTFAALSLDPNVKTQSYSIRAIDPIGAEHADPPGPTTGLVEVRRKGDLSQSVTVIVAVSGTATIGDAYDYKTPGLTFNSKESQWEVSLAAFQESTTFLVEVNDDILDESTEEAIFTIVGVTAPITNDYEFLIDEDFKSATVDIMDNDPFPGETQKVWFDLQSDPLMQENGILPNNAVVTLRRSLATEELTVSIDLGGTANGLVEGSTLTLGTDYYYPDEVTFAEGEDTVSFTLSVVDDYYYIGTYQLEAVETVDIEILAGSGYGTVTGKDVFTVTVLDNDTIFQTDPFTYSEANLPYIRFGPQDLYSHPTASDLDNVAHESGDAATFTILFEVHAPNPSGTPSWSPEWYLGGTAIEGVDYTATFSSKAGPVPLEEHLQGDWTHTIYSIRIDPIQDSEYEGPETIEIGVQPDTSEFRVESFAAPNGFTISLLDDENPLPVVSVEAIDSVSAERSQSKGSFRLIRDATNLAYPLTVEYEYNITGTEGSAIYGDDYTVAASTGPMTQTGFVTFDAGVSVIEIRLTPVIDSLAEGFEFARLAVLPDADAYSIGSNPAFVLIVDDVGEQTKASDVSLYCPPAPNPLQSPGHSTADQSKMPSNHLEAGVRAANGAPTVVATDLSLPTPGNMMAVGRSWSADPDYSAGSFLGNGWHDSSLPFLLTDGDTVRVFASANDEYVFDWNSVVGDFQARMFIRDRFAVSPSADEYTFTTPTGEFTTFYGFGGSVPEFARGRFKSRTDTAGNVLAVTSQDGDGRPLELQQSVTVDGTTVLSSILYTYGTSGGAEDRVTSATVRRKLNDGSWQTVRSVGYTYYGSSESHGNLGDLKTATRYDENATAIDADYYRYYKSGDGGGPAGAVKAVFGAESFARLTFDQTDPYAASDATADDYADLWYTYDGEDRVTSVVAAGAGCSLCTAGMGTTTFSYTENTTDPPGLNTWKTKTTETLADGNTRTTYTNAAGQVMLSVFDDVAASQEYATFHAYDRQGRLVLTARPDAVTGWDDDLPDLMGLDGGAYDYIDDDSGTVEVVDWYYGRTATEEDAGGATGYFKSVRQRRGELSTPARESAVDYKMVEGANVRSFAPATTYAIRNTDGTGAAETTYDHVWGGPNGNQLLRTTVNLPAVTDEQNGSDVPTSMTTVFDAYGRPIWSKDQAGFLSFTQYDPGTGAVVKQITDVDHTKTTTFANLPSGWMTPSGGGLHLTSTYEVDLLGRTTKATAPNGRVDYTVYKDAAREVRSYSGWDSTTNTPTGPISVSRDDLARGYSESFVMATTPSVGSGRPTGTESVAGLVSLSRSHRNKAGQAIWSDSYFNLSGVTYSTSASLGTENTHFYRTEQDYTHRGWANRSETPLGTITRTVFDGLGRPVSQWVGTDDTPTDMNPWSPTNLTGTNMVKVSEVVYDGGGVGVGNVTKQTVYPGGGAAARVTQTWYDFRNRPVITKVGVETSESTSVNRPITVLTYDNLSRVIESKLYDGDGVAITGDNGSGKPELSGEDSEVAGRLRAYSTTSFDELGRAYLSNTYSVSPTDGEIGSYTLKSNTWYDARGQVIKTSSPGGLVQKTAYDGAGRTTVSYATDGGGDTGYSDADDVTGDKVLEQSEPAYDASGNVLSQTSRQRNHDTTGTGALGTASTGNLARVSYSAMYYDVGDRLTATADYGTNGGASWSRPSAVATRAWQSFAGTDTTTVGSWSGTYGAEGYQIADGYGTSPPAYAAVSFAGANLYTWAASTSDARALQKPSPATDRVAPSWYSATSFDVDLDLTDGQAHRVHFYMLDWNYAGRTQTVEILDTATGTVLDTESVSGFSGGKWLSWDLTGHVTIRFTNTNVTQNAVLSGIFFDAPGSAPASPALVTSFDYDSAGRQWKVTDPKGHQSRTEYDALGRTLKTIEHYVDGTVGDDNDKTTEYTYNAAGMTSLTAKLTGGGGQTTEWVYGVTTGGGSTITSNEVVGATRWPDPSSGSASSGQQDSITINALGQTVTSTDRNGTVHTLTYDIVGRLMADTVTTLGTNIDGTVRRVETAYDGQGNAYLVTNYNATTSGSVVNQVQRVFNGLGQLITEYQAHGGAVNTSTSPKVQYAYSEMASAANHSRPVSMTYPNGRVIDFNYGVALDDSIGRLSALKDGATTLESYDYLGLGTVVKRGHAESGVDLTYVKQSGESNGDAGDQYIGLDRFGRIVDQRWRTSSVEKDRYQYGYDRNGNRTYKDNLVNTALGEVYSYDSLNQLTGYDRGTLNGTKTGITGTVARSQDWDYDALGNMDGVTTNSTTQTRSHNKQNEIIAVSGATSPVFDANGNMTTDETGKQYVYDAWNRLVTVKNSGGTTLASYAYDPLTRRASETDGAAGHLTNLYYSAEWQVVEERIVSTTELMDPVTITYAWSPVYVDAMIARDVVVEESEEESRGVPGESRLYVLHDANFNVTGLVTTGGTVAERYTYDPYGAAQVRDGSWTVTTTAYVWQYLHQGGRLSGESGLYAFRHRDYSPTLGRWVTVDPIGYADSYNLYSAVIQNPVNNLDFSGLYSDPDNVYGNPERGLNGYSQNLIKSGTQVRLSGLNAEIARFKSNNWNFAADLLSYYVSTVGKGKGTYDNYAPDYKLSSSNIQEVKENAKGMIIKAVRRDLNYWFQKNIPVGESINFDEKVQWTPTIAEKSSVRLKYAADEEWDKLTFSRSILKDVNNNLFYAYGGANLKIEGKVSTNNLLPKYNICAGGIQLYQATQRMTSIPVKITISDSYEFYPGANEIFNAWAWSLRLRTIDKAQHFRNSVSFDASIVILDGEYSIHYK